MKYCTLEIKMPSGGFRENAKRPLKYGEPTELVPIRVPKSKKKQFKKMIEPILKQWEVVKKKPPKKAKPIKKSRAQ